VRPWLWLPLLGCAWGAAVAAGPRGDEAGAVLAASCAGCHRDTPVEPGGIPSLRGMTADEIAEKLGAYRSGELQGTLMNRLARGYSEREIRILAAALGMPAQ
jgi:sulfide dehydrogenase cytochrome subunit